MVTRALKRLLSDRPLVGMFFSSTLGRSLRKRLYHIPVAEVARIGSALDRAGLEWFLAGGWGVDALVGHRTRRHGDLDLCVEVAADGESRAIEALAELGYEVTAARAPSGRRFPFRSVLRDRSGRTVDIILITCLDASPTDEDVPVLGGEACTTGELVLDGETLRIPCLAAAFQIELHCGYLPQERDRRDVALLTETFDLPVPPIYSRAARSRSLRTRMHGAFWEMTSRVRGISALVLEVPEAEAVLCAVGGSVPGDMPAHLTITYPFVPPRRLRPGHLQGLRTIAARTNPIKVTLPNLDHHELITFLTVTPDEPLRKLVSDVLDAWPDYPPYGDGDLDVPPHLTLGYDVLPAELADTVEPFLPVETEIDCLTLMVRGLLGQWRIAGEFPLGGERAWEPDDNH